MSRKSRRKTLSHAEIESFLCDLSNDPPVPPGKVQETTLIKVPQDTQQELPQEEMEKQQRAKIIREYYKQHQVDVRKATKEVTSPMIRYAKQIHEETTYPLLPGRLVYPEKYDHDINSLASKKALLINMQPMLSAAEKQKKVDSDLVESFTRCRVGKSRSRSSTYEYLDFDTNLRISGKEYSQRYMLYINRNRSSETDSSDSIFSAPSSETTLDDVNDLISPRKKPKSRVLKEIPLNVTNSDSVAGDKLEKPVIVQTVATDNDLDFLLSFDDEDNRHDKKKKSSERKCLSSNRRRTLSPESTKVILQQEIDETISNEDLLLLIDKDPDMTESSMEIDIFPDSVIQHSKKRSLGVDFDNASDESVRSPLKVQIQQAPSDDTIIPPVFSQESSFMQVSDISATVSTKSLYEDEENNIPGSVQATTDRASAQEVIIDSNAAEVDGMSIDQWEECSSDDKGDVERQEMIAIQRYEMRLEVAKWKYFWEVASAHAASTARQTNRFKKISRK